DIALKLDLISESSLIPILCIGESVDEKNQNKTEIILEQQLIESLSAGSKLQNLIIAYEPVWAIGSGSSAAPEEINSIHKLIKDIVQSRFSALDLQGVIYGGSVNIENAFPILEEEEVDGALIGGASLNGEEFAKIANILNELKEL
ncbi:triose-phosphate isomerase, partial [Gammaproteobacteria bacterium]|nr:triose-phosphate isomerase [Gammaproteobacteria bacterium]